MKQCQLHEASLHQRTELINASLIHTKAEEEIVIETLKASVIEAKTEELVALAQNNMLNS